MPSVRTSKNKIDARKALGRCRPAKFSAERDTDLDPIHIKATIIGSVIGNAAFVLGAAMLAGGIRNGAQRFDAQEAGHHAVLMTLERIQAIDPSIREFLEVWPEAALKRAVVYSVNACGSVAGWIMPPCRVSPGSSGVSLHPHL